jgi:hypothetical protein
MKKYNKKIRNTIRFNFQECAGGKGKKDDKQK